MNKPECTYSDPRCVTSDDCYCFGEPKKRPEYTPPLSMLDRLLERMRQGIVLNRAEMRQLAELEEDNQERNERQFDDDDDA